MLTDCPKERDEKKIAANLKAFRATKPKRQCKTAKDGRRLCLNDKGPCVHDVQSNAKQEKKQQKKEKKLKSKADKIVETVTSLFTKLNAGSPTSNSTPSPPPPPAPTNVTVPTSTSAHQDALKAALLADLKGS